jgi:hypothetical protein
LERALRSGDADVVLAVYSKVEEAWRRFATIIEEWTTLTAEFLFARDGHRLAVDGPRLEQVLELASRRGIGSDRLRIITKMLATPDNDMSTGIAQAAGEGNLSLARRIWTEAEVAMRDAVSLRCDRVNDVLGQVHELHGDQGLEEALLYAADRGFWRDALPAQAGVDPATRTAELAFFLTAGAGCSVAIGENEDRFTIEKIDCHCGRMISDHREHGWDLHVVRGPSPLTYGLEGMTPYQTHFAMIHGIWAIDHIGFPVPVFECRGLGGGEEVCSVHVYKQPDGVPPEVYATLGRAKPTAKGRR